MAPWNKRLNYNSFIFSHIFSHSSVYHGVQYLYFIINHNFSGYLVFFILFFYLLFNQHFFFFIHLNDLLVGLILSFSTLDRNILWVYSNLKIFSHYNNHLQVCCTIMHCLAMGLHSEKCVFRQFSHYANIIKCTYTNLNGITYYCYYIYYTFIQLAT